MRTGNFPRCRQQLCTGVTFCVNFNYYHSQWEKSPPAQIKIYTTLLSLRFIRLISTIWHLGHTVYYEGNRGRVAVLFARASGYCSMWPRWVDGRTAHPAACCSAAGPISSRMPLSPGPMRAAGSGLVSRVGLFNLWGGQQSAAALWVNRMDGCWRW